MWKVVFRWFGERHDPVPLEYIRQIPGVEGIVSMLIDVPTGEVWPKERILALKKTIEQHGLTFEVVESVNVHEAIKLGLPSKDRYIENYRATLRHLAEAGIRVVVYNFMPMFDWVRTDLWKVLPDGSKTMAYDHRVLAGLSPREIVDRVKRDGHSFALPGWEWERLEEIERLFALYEGMDEERLFANLVDFLKAVVPLCEELGILLAIHPDDPPFSVFGLPRIVTSKSQILRLLEAVDSPANGLALCTGSLGVLEDNDIPDMIRTFGRMGRLHFVHLRNLKRTGDRSFQEVAHPSFCGSLDMFAIVKALVEIGYSGYMRPDHGRMIWGEEGRPGYGLYDRALGIAYLLGLWEGVERMREEASPCGERFVVASSGKP